MIFFPTIAPSFLTWLDSSQSRNLKEETDVSKDSKVHGNITVLMSSISFFVLGSLHGSHTLEHLIAFVRHGGLRASLATSVHVKFIPSVSCG